MGLRSWWADQKRGFREMDERRAADRLRVIPELEPIIDAEASRGNPTVDYWHRTYENSKSMSYYVERHLRFPLDVEAIRAEFEDVDDPAVFVLADNSIGLWDLGAVLLGGKGPYKRELEAEWTAARERWWQQWHAGPQRRRQLRIPWADRHRTIPALEPVIEAERARANVTKDFWHRADAGTANAGWYERHLVHPLDVEALEAEFNFDEDVWVREDRAVSVHDEAILLGGDKPLTADQRAARERWWTQWRADPRPRRRLSATIQ